MPLHETVRTTLRDRILTGALPVGAALPTTAELSVEFGASRGPVRQALAALAAEGLISTGQGRVPTVTRAPFAHAIDDFFSFSAWVTAMGRVPGQRTIELALRRPPAPVAAALGVGGDARAVDLVRVRSIDDEPVMIERSTFVEHVGRLIFDFDPDAGSVFTALLDRGVSLEHGEHTIDAVAANDQDAAALDVAVGTPLLRVHRLTRSAAGEVIEVADDRYRPDRASLIVHNSRTRTAPAPSAVRRTTTEGTR